jgi:hypothetical protein
MEIKYVAEVITSKRDIYGNSYHLVYLIRTSDGRGLWGNMGSGNNVRYLLQDMLPRGEFLVIDRTIAIRDWQQMAKGKEHMSDHDIQAFVTDVPLETTTI